jgi:hypothetical protein
MGFNISTQCHFAHGEHELRKVAKKPRMDTLQIDMDRRPIEELNLPNRGISSARYFIVKPFNYGSMAISAKRKQWAVHSDKMYTLNQAFATSGTLFVGLCLFRSYRCHDYLPNIRVLSSYLRGHLPSFLRG